MKISAKYTTHLQWDTNRGEISRHYQNQFVYRWFCWSFKSEHEAFSILCFRWDSIRTHIYMCKNIGTGSFKYGSKFWYFTSPSLMFYKHDTWKNGIKKMHDLRNQKNQHKWKILHHKKSACLRKLKYNQEKYTFENKWTISENISSIKRKKSHAVYCNIIYCGMRSKYSQNQLSPEMYHTLDTA